MAEDEMPAPLSDHLTTQAQSEERNAIVQNDKFEATPSVSEAEEAINAPADDRSTTPDATVPIKLNNVVRETVTEETPQGPRVYTKVLIDSDSENDLDEQEELIRNFFLPYADHNYDTVEKKNRAKYLYDEEFQPVYGTDDYGKLLSFEEVQAMTNILHSQPEQLHQSASQSHLQPHQVQQAHQHHPHHAHQQQSMPNPHLPRPVTMHNTVKQYQQNQYNMGNAQEHPRSEPSIVARAPAHRDGAVYRVNAQTEFVPNSGGYMPVPRTMNMLQNQRSAQAVRARAELSQSGQPFMGGAGQHPQSHLVPVRSGMPIARRQPQPHQQQQHHQQQHQQQQAGNPGAYQHIHNPTPNPLLRRPNLPVRSPANTNILHRTGIRQVLPPKGSHVIDQFQEGLASGDAQNISNVTPQIPVQRRIADMAPHRMTPEQRIAQQSAVAQARQSQFPVMEGCAPMLVPARGSKLLVRGRAGSSTARRREDGLEQQAVLSSQPNISHRSPQRQYPTAEHGQHPTPLHHIQQSSQQNQYHNRHYQPSGQQEQHYQRELPVSPRKIPLGDYAHSSPSSVSLHAPAQSNMYESLPAQLTEDQDVAPHPPLRAAPATPLKSPMKPMMQMVKPTPPHRMTQEEKNAHIARHLEKDKPAPSITSALPTVPPLPNAILAPQVLAAAPPPVTNAPSVPEVHNEPADSVALVVAAVATAVSNSPASSSARAILPKPFQLEQINNDALKEKHDILKLANELKMSAESIQAPETDRVVKNGPVAHPKPNASLAPSHSDATNNHHAHHPHHPHNNRHSNQNHNRNSEPESWGTREMSTTAIQQTIANIQDQIAKEKASGIKPEKKPRNSLPKQPMEPPPMNMIGLPHSLPHDVVGTTHMATPEAQAPRQRGRPKGSTGNRQRYGSIQEGGNMVAENGRTPTNGRIGQGVRTLAPVLRQPPPVAPNYHSNVGANDMEDNKDSDSESDGVKQADDYGEDWTMRCHCGMKHGSGLCVYCEKCDTWQHILCMGLKSEADVPKNYQCELCEPRQIPVTKTEARRLQRGELEKGKLENQKKKQREAEIKRGRKSVSKEAPRPPRKSKEAPPPYSDSNEYSRTATRLLKSLGSTIGAADLLADAKRNQRAKRMFVLENVEGLVTIVNVDGRAVVMELCGYVCRMNECARDFGGSPFIFQYDGLLKGPTGEDVGIPTGNELICIDTRKKGNDAKFTRRSCVPNCVLKHVLDKRGTLGVMIVATKDMPHNTEITLPFDNDFKKRTTRLPCVDHAGLDPIYCPLEMERLRYQEYERYRLRNVEVQEENIAMEEATPEAPKEEEEKKPEPKEEVEVASSSSNGQSVAAEPRKRKGRPSRANVVNDSLDVSASTSAAEPQAVASPSPVKVEVVEKKEKPGRKTPPIVTKAALKEKEEPKKEVMTYELPSEKQKLSREERKSQHYESMFLRQEELEKKRLNKAKAKEGTSSARTSGRGVSIEKDDVKPEEKVTPSNKIEKRTSARVAKTSVSSSTTDEAPTKLTKKRRLDSDRRSTSSARSAAPQEAKEAVNSAKRTKAEEETVEVPLRKLLPKRHVENTPSHSSSPAPSTSSPAKKTRRTANEETSILGEDFLAKVKENALLGTKTTSDFQLNSIGKDEKPSKEVRQFREEMKQKQDSEERRRKNEELEETLRIIQERKRKEEENAVEKVEKARKEREAKLEEEKRAELAKRLEEERIAEEERKAEMPPPKKEQKKLSISEYKLRRTTATPTTSREDVLPKGVGFIPSTEGSSTHPVSLGHIALESEGGQPDPNQQAVQEAVEEELPQHQMSLKDRFFNVFSEDALSSSLPQPPASQDEAKRRSRTRWQ